MNVKINTNKLGSTSRFKDTCHVKYYLNKEIILGYAYHIYIF